MSSRSGGARKSRSTSTGTGKEGKSGPGGGVAAPWHMTYNEFVNYKVPSPMSDHSRSPGDVMDLRDEGSLLSDYTGDRFTLNDFLGKGYDSRYDMSHLAGAVQAGRSLTIYRATDAETEIWPGAYVALSRAYAVDHGERNMGGAKYHVLTATARPDELVAMNPNEFFYVPRDLRAYHKAQVRAAVKAGKPVPDKVKAEYGL